MHLPVRPVSGFWGRTTPCEHLLEVYKNETAFLDGLVAFAGDGLARGEAFVVIANATHRDALAQGLRRHGQDPAAAGNAYVELDAGRVLAKLIVDGQADRQRFLASIGAAIAAAHAGHRPVRAFGEMVTLLWLAGQHDAAVQLEQLWNELLHRYPLTLLCASPRLQEMREITDDFAAVCAAHSQLAFT